MNAVTANHPSGFDLSDLDSDLRPCVTSGPSGLWFVRHPLLHTLLADASSINPIYRHRRDRLSKLLADRDFEGALFVYESPYQLEVLNELLDHFDAPKRRELLAAVWRACEYPSSHDTEMLVSLFQRVGFVSDGPFDPPIGEMTIFRGGHRDGMSWTSDIRVAEMFRTRFGKDEDLWRATVHGEDVLAMLSGRGEFEVVVNPDTLLYVRGIDPPPARASAGSGDHGLDND